MSDKFIPASSTQRFTLISASVYSAIAGLLVVTILLLLFQRNTVLKNADTTLLYDATFTAQNLDTTLKLADVALDYSKKEFLRLITPEEEAGVVTSVAFQIKGVENIYLLDEEGRVLSTAIKRNEPILLLGDELKNRLREGVDSGCYILEVPAEGGKALVLMKVLRREFPVRYAAAIFSRFDVQARFMARMPYSWNSFYLTDSVGETFSPGNSLLPEEKYSSDIIEASLAFSSWPVRIHFLIDKKTVLREWRSRAYVQVGTVFVFICMVVVMLAYGVAQGKRAVRADLLQKELKASETLFKEVNHRVKNNLAIIQSILNFAKVDLADNPNSAGEALSAAENRIGSISTLHDLLYHSSTPSDVDLGKYIVRLTDSVRGLNEQDERIEVHVNVDSGLFVRFNVAMDCGMTINELLTNAYKYAFPDDRKGFLTIEATGVPDGRIRLKVADNGIGTGKDYTADRGLGMEIVRMLMEKNGAVVKRSSNNPSGTVWEIMLPDSSTRPKPPPRPAHRAG